MLHSLFPIVIFSLLEEYSALFLTFCVVVYAPAVFFLISLCIIFTYKSVCILMIYIKFNDPSGSQR